MARPLHYRTANIRLSFQRALGSIISVESVGQDGSPIEVQASVSFDSPWDDDEGIRLPEAVPDRAIITTTWTNEMAGRGGDSLLMLDVWTRVGAPDDPDADPYGILCDDLADAVEDKFAGPAEGGGLKAWVPIYDFSNPLDPTPVGEGANLLVGYGFGVAPGQPNSRRKWRRSGLNRVALVYSVQVITDLVPNHDYADL